MTERISRLLQVIRKGEHHGFRREVIYSKSEQKVESYDFQRVTRCFQTVLAEETPIILKDQEIVFLRTVKNLPPIFEDMEWQQIKASHYIHEQGRVCNLAPEYEKIICNGLKFEKQRCLVTKQRILSENVEHSKRIAQWLDCVILSMDAILDLTNRYRLKALEEGKLEVARTLARVPEHGATSFREALQAFRILHYALWCEGEYHNTVGRFDLYMYPYLKADLESGRLTEKEAFELLEEFFLSFNWDSDLYPGIQQGDNGQSLMLGGIDCNGNHVFNLLSEMCLKASRELLVIDPKINLRVNKETLDSIYVEGTRLTKAGLGFPQYSNEDIVVQGLMDAGYEEKDARNFTVAACWEFIIPGKGMDIPNIGAVNFPVIINDVMIEKLNESENYEEFYGFVVKKLRNVCKEINDSIHHIYMVPAPFMSIFMDGCIEFGKDISEGNKYNNFGFHGVGISTAVDSLAVIQKCIFEEKSITKEDAIDLINGTKEDEDLARRLRFQEPKFGNDEERTNHIAKKIFADFGEAVKPLKNERGGKVRAGSGSAMFYLWYADCINNTLSGHRKGDSFSANYAPELFVKNKGPLSVIASLTKPDFTKVINGGPMTMEFHSSVFKGEEGIEKVALLVKKFISLGGHQLQLNSVNKEMLLDAQEHPEQYQNLIVRIWGWSAYFVELDKEYQDHVIARQEFVV